MNCSDAEGQSEEDERGIRLAEAMLDGSLMGIDSLSVGESTASCILSHPDPPIRKVLISRICPDHNREAVMLVAFPRSWHSLHTCLMMLQCMGTLRQRLPSAADATRLSTLLFSRCRPMAHSKLLLLPGWRCPDSGCTCMTHRR
jgi:hypothetical protein